MTNSTMELTYDNLEDIVKEVTGETGQRIRGVNFRLMYHRRNPSGIEISVRYVDWKKTCRRIRSLNGLISISRLKVAYDEMREIYDTDIQPQIVERDRRDGKIDIMNGVAKTFSDVTVSVHHDITLRSGFSINVAGNEEFIEDVLFFLESRCGRKGN